MNKKFLQIGLGSMGKRRIRNLLANGIAKENIFGFDPAEKMRQEAENKYGIKTFADFGEAKQTVNPDAYIISTPPNLHAQYYMDALKEKKNFFVEVGVTDEGYTDLINSLDGSFVAAPSCTMRHLPAIKKIKEILSNNEIGKVLFFQYHVGQYLPDWHPWEDFRKVYFAQKETGGCREMFVFELIWLTDILQGGVKNISGLTRKISDLDMPADDIYTAIVNLDNEIIGTIIIDLLSRDPKRTLRITGSEGELEWEWLDYQIKIFKASDKKWQTIDLKKGEPEAGYNATEDMYIEEIKTFLDAIDNKKDYPYSFADDHKILKTLYALEKSNKKEQVITL